MGLALLGHVQAGHYQLKPRNPPQFPKNPYGGTIHYDDNSSAYSSNQGTYGASQGDAGDVECECTITTVYVWVRDQIEDPDNPGQLIDDPLDNPPDQVISKEYSMVLAEAYSITGAFAYADNGLGFPAESEGDETYAWAKSEGTLYKKRAGGQEITLTASPAALASSDIWDAYAAVVYTSSILVPKVQLEGTTRFYSPQAVMFLTGQQITELCN